MPLTREHLTLPHLSEKLWGEYDDNAAAVPAYEQEVLENARDSYRRGQLSPEQSGTQVRQQLRQRPEVEDQQFKDNLSAASPSYGTALTGMGVGAGAGYLLDHAIHGVGRAFGSQQKAHPFTTHLKGMVGGGLLGKGLGWMRLLPLAFMAQHYGTQAALNPAYQRGEQGYLGSLGSTIANAGQSTRDSMSEANERYGTLGALPLHALNVAMDPLGATLAAGSKAKEMLFGKSSEYLLSQVL